MKTLAHGKIIKLVIMGLFCIVVVTILISTCAFKTKFQSVMNIDIPPGMRVEHEVLYKNWDYVVYSYYAVLSGNYDSFKKMVQILELERATNVYQLVLLQPGGAGGEDTSWWQPPSSVLQTSSLESLEIYCDRIQRDPKRTFIEETSAHYENGKIHLFRTYMNEISNMNLKRYRRISEACPSKTNPAPHPPPEK